MLASFMCSMCGDQEDNELTPHVSGRFRLSASATAVTVFNVAVNVYNQINTPRAA